MNSSTKKIKQLVKICDELDVELISYAVKRLHGDWNKLTYIAVVEHKDDRVQTMIYDKELEVWR